MADRSRPTFRRYFPEPAERGSTPIALAQVIPGGFVAASQAIREQIDGARERLDVMNPYLTDRGMVERILAAARRGVTVRVVVSKRSNNPQATAALRHRYADLLAAGVEVWSSPARSSTPRSWSPTTSSASARSTSTHGRSTATRRS